MFHFVPLIWDLMKYLCVMQLVQLFIFAYDNDKMKWFEFKFSPLVHKFY